MSLLGPISWRFCRIILRKRLGAPNFEFLEWVAVSFCTLNPIVNVNGGCTVACVKALLVSPDLPYLFQCEPERLSCSRRPQFYAGAIVGGNLVASSLFTLQLRVPFTGVYPVAHMFPMDAQ